MIHSARNRRAACDILELVGAAVDKGTFDRLSCVGIIGIRYKEHLRTSKNDDAQGAMCKGTLQNRRLAHDV